MRRQLEFSFLVQERGHFPNCPGCIILALERIAQLLSKYLSTHAPSNLGIFQIARVMLRESAHHVTEDGYELVFSRVLFRSNGRIVVP